MVTRGFTVILVMVLSLGGCATTDAEPSRTASDESTSQLREVMQAKLVLTGEILRGIAIGDTQIVAGNADELALLSELSEWQVHDTATYTAFSREFQARSRELAVVARAGYDDQIDAVYLRLTESCIRCHAYLRREGLIRQMPGHVANAGGTRPRSRFP